MGLAVDQVDPAGLLGHPRHPGQQAPLIGVGRIPAQGVHAGAYIAFLSIQGDGSAVAAIPLNGSSGCPGGLISHKHNIIFRLLDTGRQVIDDPSAGAHPASGNDHRRPFHFQQPGMLDVFLDPIQLLEIDGMIPCLEQRLNLLFPKLRQARIDSRDLQPQR